MAPLTISDTLSLKLPALLDLVERAGAAIMAIYSQGASGTRYKADGSPVTDADYASNRLIQQGLAELTPEWPVVSEEGDADGLSADEPDPVGDPASVAAEVFWLLDPLDGTREFVARNDEFAISLALVVSGQPRFGVIYAPALNECYWGGAEIGVYRRLHGEVGPARCRPLPQTPVVLMSRTHSDSRVQLWLEQCREQGLHPLVEPLGSALKLARLAAGAADAYPRFGTTMAWDTAAGQALLAAAGGACLNRRGESLRWGQGWRNDDFVALADPSRWGWLWGGEKIGER